MQAGSLLGGICSGSFFKFCFILRALSGYLSDGKPHFECGACLLPFSCRPRFGWSFGRELCGSCAGCCGQPSCFSVLSPRKPYVCCRDTGHAGGWVRMSPSRGRGYGEAAVGHGLQHRHEKMQEAKRQASWSKGEGESFQALEKPG